MDLGEIRLGEQAREARVRSEADQLESDEPGTDQGQPAQVVSGLVEIPAFEQQHGVSAVGPEVRLADDTRLDQRPQCTGFLARERSEGLGRRVGRFRLEGDDAHGVLSTEYGAPPAGQHW